MTVQRFVRSPWMLLVGAALATLMAVGCGEDNGTTSKCPELPLYDIRTLDEAGLAQQKAERETAAATGCVTAPGDSGVNVIPVDSGSTD